ncbi:MAG: Hpt domain-containing protein [Xanthomonadaceae bacterium]|nr:Hpt domain-containing protein [Xanthomonadaceae bacterium]
MLAELVNHFIVNLSEQIGQPPRAAVIELWPQVLVGLLEHPAEASAQEAFAELLTDPRWPQPMDRDQADRVIAKLLECDTVLDGEARATREFTATDVDLALHDDLTIEMQTAFEHEAPLFAARLTREVANLDGRNPAEALRQARRAAHTLKGSATLVGARGVVSLTHLLEELLEILQERVEALSPELIGDLQNAGDTLEEMIETVLGHAAPPDTILEVLRNIDHWIVQLGQPADPAEAGSQSSEVAGLKVDTPTPASPAGDPGASGPMVANSTAPEASAESGSPEPSLNVPVRVIDEMLRSMSEMLVHFSHLQTALRSTTERSDQMHKHLAVLQGSVHEIETMVDLRGTPFMQAGSRTPKAVDEAHAGDRPDGFDPLELDQYNQLHSLSRRFAESALDAREMAHGLHEHLGVLGNRALHQQRLAQELNCGRSRN